MKLRSIPLRGILAGLIALGAAGVFVPSAHADARWRGDWHHGWHHGWYHHWHPHHWWRGRWWGPPAVYSPPPRFYYAPPPAYYYRPPPVYAPGVTFGLFVR